MIDMRLWHLYKQKWIYDFTLTSDGLVYLDEWKHNTLLNPIPIEKAGVVPCRKTPLVSDKGESIYEGDFILIRYLVLGLKTNYYEGFITYTPLGFYLTSKDGTVISILELVNLIGEGTLSIDLLGNRFETHYEMYRELSNLHYVLAVYNNGVKRPTVGQNYFVSFDKSTKLITTVSNLVSSPRTFSSYFESLEYLLYLRSAIREDDWSFDIEVLETRKEAFSHVNYL